MVISGEILTVNAKPKVLLGPRDTVSCSVAVADITFDVFVERKP